MLNRIKDIIKYKELLYNLTSKELKLKYKNSVLGFFWSFLNPIMMLVVYTFAFKYVLGMRVENFSVFILSGLLPWNFFQMSVQGSTFSLVGNANLIKKVYFPREIIPLSLVLANFINFLITFIVLFAALFIFQVKIGLPFLLLPVVLLLLLLLTIGLCIMLSALNVVYRDVSHFVEIVFMAWFYLTPIVYSMNLIPQKVRWLLLLNPMTSFVESIRACVLYNRFPDLYQLGIMLAFDVIFILIGYAVFTRIEKSFAETI